MSTEGVDAVNVKPEAVAVQARLEWRAGRQEWSIMLCLALITVVIGLDATIVVPALPNIAQSLGLTAVQTFWIGSSYLVPYAVCQPLVAALSDSFGRLWLLLFSILAFAVGSIVGGVASTVTQILAGRVSQGIGGGGITCIGMIIATDIIPLRQRAKFMGITQLAWAIGTVSGPLIGGALASSWHWLFWINLFFCGPALVISPLVVKLHKRDATSVYRMMLRFDWVGAVLFIGGSVALLIGLSFGGLNFAWSSWRTLLPITLGASGVLAALAWMSCIVEYPFINTRLYSSYSIKIALFTTFLQGFLLWGILYFWSIYFQGVLGKSAMGTGVALLPLMLVTAPSCVLASVLISRFGKFKPAITAAWILLVLGNGLPIALGVHSPAVAWTFILMTVGIGHGMFLTGGSMTLQSHAPAQFIDQAAAMHSLMRALGLAVGVSINGTIFQNRLSYWLKQSDLPHDIALDIFGYIRVLNNNSHAPGTIAIRLAIAKALRNGFEIATGLSGVGLLLILVVKHADMNKDIASKHVLQRQSMERADGVESNA